MLEMFKVLQAKPIEKLRNGNFNLGTNTYMMFEPNPATQKKDNVKITRPNPAEHPDAYDEKGDLTDMYKDPDMGLGFAEWEKFYPNPHTKYDKFFIDGAPHPSPVALLSSAADRMCSAGRLQHGHDAGGAEGEDRGALQGLGPDTLCDLRPDTEDRDREGRGRRR